MSKPDDVISPEDLKIIAAGMGYIILKNCNGHWAINKGEGSGVWEYNPLTNDSQMVEIINKLKLNIDSSIEGRIGAKIHSDRYWVIGKTLNLAVCRAGVEYFKGKM